MGKNTQEEIIIPILTMLQNHNINPVNLAVNLTEFTTHKETVFMVPLQKVILNGSHLAIGVPDQKFLQEP